MERQRWVNESRPNGSSCANFVWIIFKRCEHPFFRRYARRADNLIKYRYSKDHGVPYFKHKDGSVRLATDLTEHQVILENWFSFYDWVLGPDGPSPKPDQEIVDDDAALDAFIKDWKDSLKQKPEDSGDKKG